MLRPLAVPALLLAFGLAACGDDDGATPSPSASTNLTVTGTPRHSAVVECPHVSLALNAAQRDGTLTDTTWQDRDCAMALAPHPAGEIVVGLGGLGLLGDVELLVTPGADALRAIAWEPGAVRVADTAPLQVSLAIPADFRPTELAVQASQAQTLGLGALPPGDYVVQVTGEWPEGTASFAFYVEMLAEDSTLELPDYIGGPAAGICLIAAADVGVVTIELQPGMPSPRCVGLRPSQRLEVVNLLDATQDISLGAFVATLAPGESATSDLVAGDFLAPGHHILQTTAVPAEVMLLASEISAEP